MHKMVGEESMNQLYPSRHDCRDFGTLEASIPIEKESVPKRVSPEADPSLIRLMPMRSVLLRPPNFLLLSRISSDHSACTSVDEAYFLAVIHDYKVRS